MKTIINIFLYLLIPFTAISQHNYVISGYITDKQSGEALIGATIVEKTLQKGTISNGYGFYSLSLSEGLHTITVSYLGYENFNFDVVLKENLLKDIELPQLVTSLNEVAITSEYKNEPTKLNEFSMERLSIKEIGKLPSLLGEVDVIKTIQLQSGVKSIGDGSSGMFIRGGGSDQNLILIDEAPIYNPSHLFGLISVFNPDALNHVTLFKSNMPAQYGGRVSSVIDCKMKEGNLRKYNFSAGLSPFSTIITMNGPIKKESSSFLFSARKSLVDIFIKPGETMVLVPAFYDLNIKMNSKIGIKDRVFLSVYYGKDRIESADGFFNKWGNTSTTFRWNRNSTDKLFLNVSLIYSNYENYLEFKDEGKEYKWLTGLNDINAKFDLSYYIRPDNFVKFGVGSIYHKFIPGETADKLQSISRIQAFEHSLYFLNDIKPVNWFGVNYGLRFSAFQNTGNATWYDYDDNYYAVNKRENLSGVYNTYWSLEPRISANISLHTDYSIKVAYARNAQYMQVLQNASLSYTSLETWFPATPNIKPIITDVMSFGWFQNLSGLYSFSIESYYKTFQNHIDYVDHARLVNNPYIEGEIRMGTAKAYGMEINFKKEIGKLTGSFSYVYSRAVRKIEGINDNKEYNSPYDIPHDFRINGNYQISHKWSISSVWMFMTGRPVTLPVGFYYEGKELVPIYSGQNLSRFPDYHRLDIGVSFNTKTETKKSYWIINFGAYNVYARKNPLGYEFVKRKASKGIDVYQYTLFTIMPNFSLKFNF